MVVQELEKLIEATIVQIYGINYTTKLVVPKNLFGGQRFYASNVSFRLSEQLKKSPADISCEIASALPQHRYIDAVEAVNGYINILLSKVAIADIVCRLHDADNLASSDVNAGKAIALEFVSANPTGPLSVVNGRAAAIGSSLANILETTGASVTTRYYINDNPESGQLVALKNTLDYYDKVNQGEQVEFPEDGYKGEFIKSVWKKYHAFHAVGDIAFGAVAVNYIIQCQQADLDALGVYFDSFDRESVYMKGWTLDRLFSGFGVNLSDFTYIKDGATWLKTSEYGDSKDRVIIRADGRPTYFHNDIIYHAVKYYRSRNADSNVQLINIFGADHHGYIDRLNAVMRMWGLSDITVLLTQMVSLETTDENGVTSAYIGSKREGQYLHLKEDFIDRVGCDAARWYFLSETLTAHLKINVDKATEQNMSNPVFYVQYAHARFAQILSKASTLGITLDGHFANLYLLNESEAAVQLILKLNEYESVVASAAEKLSPHVIKTYLYELAQLAHKYYASGRLIEQAYEECLAGLYLVTTTNKVLKHGLGLLGISAPLAMVALDE
mgnify:CR=1 FL=1